jgi:hypothetical protein
LRFLARERRDRPLHFDHLSEGQAFTRFIREMSVGTTRQDRQSDEDDEHHCMGARAIEPDGPLGVHSQCGSIFRRAHIGWLFAGALRRKVERRKTFLCNVAVWLQLAEGFALSQDCDTSQVQKELRAITNTDGRSVVILQMAWRIMPRGGCVPPRRTDEVAANYRDMESNGMCVAERSLQP